MDDVKRMPRIPEKYVTMYLPLAMRAMEETGNKLRPLMAIYKIKSASDFRKFYRFSQYEQQTGCRFKEDNGRALRLLQLVYEKCKVYNSDNLDKSLSRNMTKLSNMVMEMNNKNAKTESEQESFAPHRIRRALHEDFMPPPSQPPQGFASQPPQGFASPPPQGFMSLPPQQTGFVSQPPDESFMPPPPQQTGFVSPPPQGFMPPPSQPPQSFMSPPSQPPQSFMPPPSQPPQSFMPPPSQPPEGFVPPITQSSMQCLQELFAGSPSTVSLSQLLAELTNDVTTPTFTA